MNRKYPLIILPGSVLAVCAMGLAYTIWSSGPPDPSTQSPEEIAKYVASGQFARLDVAEKRQYLSQTRRGLFRAGGDLSEADRRKLRENIRPVFRRAMEERIDKYFELEPEQQTAYLDEMIDRMESMRQARPERPEGERRRRPGFSPERMKRMIENTPPERRAKFAEFMKAMRQRRQARGLGSSR